MKTILAVDDDRAALDSFRFILGNRYNLLLANNGMDALHTMEERDVDLVLLDILMPGMDGYTCLKFLKADNITKDIPVVILTVRSEKKIGDIFKAEGIKGFLEKPYEPDKLLGIIKKVIGD